MRCVCILHATAQPQEPSRMAIRVLKLQLEVAALKLQLEVAALQLQLEVAALHLNHLINQWSNWVAPA